eukprot:5593951-Amphidinium_carterae.1
MIEDYFGKEPCKSINADEADQSKHKNNTPLRPNRCNRCFKLSSRADTDKKEGKKDYETFGRPFRTVWTSLFCKAVH